MLFVLYTLLLGLNVFSIKIKIVTEPSTDYGEVTTNLTFSSCENKTCINVTIVNDNVAEETEVFTVRLQKPANPDSSISLIPNSAEVQVEDNDGRRLSAFCVLSLSKHMYVKKWRFTYKILLLLSGVADPNTSGITTGITTGEVLAACVLSLSNHMYVKKWRFTYKILLLLSGVADPNTSGITTGITTGEVLAATTLATVVFVTLIAAIIVLMVVIYLKRARSVHCNVDSHKVLD